MLQYIGVSRDDIGHMQANDFVSMEVIESQYKGDVNEFTA